MGIKRGFTIEFPVTARLVFDGMGVKLAINPRPKVCEFKFDPSAGNYTCERCKKSGMHTDHFSESEHSGGPMHIPATRVIDESRDSDAPWFAFWEEDCMNPPIWIVRAESFEQAYEDFCATLPEVKIEDLDEDQIKAEKEGNLSGYSYADGVGLVYTECINGREIELIEVTA